VKIIINKKVRLERNKNGKYTGILHVFIPQLEVKPRKSTSYSKTLDNWQL
jgi:hypothetical protein